MPLISSAYNNAIGNKWILVIPFKQIDSNASIDNLSLNLTSCTVPDREILSTNFDIYGRGMPLPTGVKDDDKIITCKYMLSSNWHQYTFLNKWFNMYTNDHNSPDGPLDQTLIDCSLYLLSEFKQPVFSITFTGCWLSHLGGMTLNYQTGQKELEPSFKFRYAMMDFSDIE